MQKTRNELIFIGKPIEMNDDTFEEQLERLDKLAKEETGQMKEIVKEIVPTYHPDI